MTRQGPSRARLAPIAGKAIVVLAAVALVLLSAPGTWSQPTADHDAWRRTVVDAEFLGMVTFDTGYTFADTEVGGLSSIAWDGQSPAGTSAGQYYALSDDRSQRDPARFYTVSIDLSDGALDDGDVVFDAVTTLRDVDGESFAAGAVDPEGIALSSTRTLFISSEGDAGQLMSPWVRELSLGGEHIRELPLPDHYVPTESGDRGIRHNLAFEPLTITPDGRTLLTGTENALLQDGPATDVETGSPSRLLSYDVASGQPGPEYVFRVSPIPKAPVPPATFADNGLVEHIALDDVGTLLSLERSYAIGPGNTVRLFETRVGGALDVSGLDALMAPDSGETYIVEAPAEKAYVGDLEELGVKPDNLEGMALGPVLPDGRQSLILVSDNNFNAAQTTQFIALALEIEAVPAAVPAAESPAVVDAEDVPEGALPGQAHDIALYMDPSQPGPARLIAAMGSGGVLLMDIDGRPIATASTQRTDGSYTSVDVLLGFELNDGSDVDLAVVADNRRDSVDVFAIIDDGLRPVTSESMPAPLLDSDQSDGSAYGVATYSSLISGRQFAFVTQSGGNLVAQVELKPEPGDRVGGEVVRTVELPVWDGDRSGGTAFGIAVAFYPPQVIVAFENAPAIVAFGGEPEAPFDSGPEVIIADEKLLRPPLGGLAMHDFGADALTLLVAHRSDSSIAAFRGDQPHGYRGRFVVAGGDEVDAMARPMGLAITGLMVDPGTYRSGLLAVTDASNEPQLVVEDSGRLRNASAGFKLVPWRDDLLPPIKPEPTIYLPRVVRGE